MEDMKVKGRSSPHPIHTGTDHWRHKYPEKIQRGEHQSNAKLTSTQAIQMRRDYLSGMKQSDIAKANGLSENSVQDITLGRSWKHLLGVNGAPTLEELKAFSKECRKTNAKVTQAIAEEIRRRLANGELGKDLAAEFGIHKATVSDIKLRKIWAD
jgi:transposase